ncbi:MAG: type II secretion system F family protein [Nanoarchaeota archaeon]|nr:type II secretion system F family protein [Nanoarchaeota archaeon]
MTAVIFKKIANSMPSLKAKLVQAGIYDPPEKFVRKTVITAFYMLTALLLIGFMIFSKTPIPKFLLLLAPVLFVVLFFYFIKLPDVKILRREKEINQEIVYAGRFIIIELESGVPIYQTFKHVVENYDMIGKYFAEIVHDVDLGTPIEDAINRVVETTPSRNFRKLLWQILNSITTGADMTISLKAVVDQIVTEQDIELKEYGRKLNPLAMFFMILAVILPSIGITLLVIFASFIGLRLDLTFFLLLAAAIGFLQFLFYAVIKNSRPAGQFT